MNARRTRSTVLAAAVLAGLAAPAVAQAGGTPAGCAAGPSRQQDLAVSASYEARSVRAGGHWLSAAVVERTLSKSTKAPAAGVAVDVVLRAADGHLVWTSGTTDSLGKVTLDLALPARTAAGLASVTWTAHERVDVPCGPAVDSYGERVAPKAVRVTR